VIRDAEPTDYPAVAGLMRAFVEWQHTRHASDRTLIDGYFDEAAFEAELDALPGAYAPPDGALLVAEQDGRIVGCVALKRVDQKRCEMKRLFVDLAAHGPARGGGLAQAAIERGKALGYEMMMLDTGPKQIEAQTLYRKLGFRAAQPYYEMEPELRAWLVFMERDLG
jgi:putative acetyltransferase